MKHRSLCLTVSLLLLSLSALASPTDVPRILLVGDSWPGFLQIFRCFDTVIQEYPDLAGYGQRGHQTTLVGVRASEFNTPEFMDVVLQELNTYPTIDIVHLSLGGNDFVMDIDWTPSTPQQEVQAFIDMVNTHVETIIDQILAVRPNIRVALCSYDCGDHEMGDATPAQMNALWLQFEQSRLAMAQRKDRVFYVHNLGLMQYHYGIPQADPPIPPYTVPYPGGYPDYDPMPGGDPNYNSPLEALMDDDLHLTLPGYDILAKRCIDEFYHTWLTWPAVLEVLPQAKNAKDPFETFLVTFSESVTGVDTTDFAADGVPGATIESVDGAGATYTVTVNLNGGTGPATLRVLDDDTIIDANSNPLGGPDADNGGFAHNGPLHYADPALNGDDDFQGAMYSLDRSFMPAAWMLGGQSFLPENCDANGGGVSVSPPGIIGNNMLDDCELGLVYTVLHDPAIDLSATGGLTHAQVLEAWQHNIERMRSDVGGADSRVCVSVPGIDTMLAGFMTLGDSGSTAIPTLLVAAVGAFIEFPGATVPMAANYICLANKLGPAGDADGDGFTNRQEYDYFFPQGGKDAYIAAALDPNTVPDITEGEGGGEGEGEGGGEGEGETEGEEPDGLDFCYLMDKIYAVTQSEAMAPLVEMLGDNAALLNMIQCGAADLNGPFVDTDTPPDGQPDLPGPNGLLDAAYELGVLAALVNTPDAYAGLPTGTLPGQSAPGVAPASAATAFQANYDALYTPLAPFIPILPTLVESIAEIELTEEQTEQILDLLPDLISILAGYATLGDADSLGVVLFLTNLLGGFISGLPTEAADFQTLNAILGPDGDADGDGFTNRQEYAVFSGVDAKTGEPGPEAYVNAALDPGTNPDRPEGLLNFCKIMDKIFIVTQSEAMAPLIEMLGDNASLLTMIQCSAADLNGPFVDTDTPPDGEPDLPGPNGLLDGAYELGVLAELVNFGANYAGLPSGTLPGQTGPGVDPAAVAAAFQANYDALFTPLEPFIPILPNLVEGIAEITLTEEQTEQIQGLLPDLISILAGYATLGDTNSLGIVLFLTNLLGDFIATLPTEAADFQTLNAILGPDGDADGDGFTNHQEYTFFSALKGAREYVNAALNPAINPDNPGEGETIEGEGGSEGEGETIEGEGGAEGEGETIEGEGGEGEGEGAEGQGGEGEGESGVEGEGASESPYCTADQDHNNQINLSELLRVIQFFNSGGYHCQSGTEDGFAPGPGDTSCASHSSDYNEQDWAINLSELLRLIQFFNSGGYHLQSGTEDGFAPGL